MSDVLCEVHDKICLLTLNRAEKQNAFDNALLTELHQQIDAAVANTTVRVLVIKANGKNFCAGADIGWMQGMVGLSEEDNIKDALVLGSLMYALYQCPKPTLAMIQGAAFGGGAGIAAACDVAIAATNARFCFSETRLGLIPAVISPYVVRAIGQRMAQMLFMSAELIDAQRALAMQLIHHCVPEEQLLEYTLNYAKTLCANAPEAVVLAKKLAREVANKTLDETLVYDTASLIAQKRVSTEGQKGLKAFLNKETPNW